MLALPDDIIPAYSPINLLTRWASNIKQGIEYLIDRYEDEFIKSKIQILIDYGFDNIKRDCCEIDFNKYEDDKQERNNMDKDIDVYRLLDLGH